MAEKTEQLKTLYRWVRGIKPVGHGPFHEANNGWVDPKPYVDVRTNGIFEGYDNSLWKYYKFPDDVKIEWNKDKSEAMFNQHFFVDLVDDLADQLNNQTERVMRDERRKFHMQVTQDLKQRIKPYPGCTPANADYLRRMSIQYRKPEWTGYIGFKLLPSHAFTEAHGAVARVQRWWEMMRNPDALNFYLYKQDINELDNKMIELGFDPLDFKSPDGREDFERMTAWHGVYDDDYGLPNELESTVMNEPIHGMSIITPRWGELTFHAVKPREDLFMTDPASEMSRWAKPLFRPGSEAVVINIRGEIRSPQVGENLLDSKRLIKIDSNERLSGSRTASISEKEEERSKESKLDRARAAAGSGHGLLDNVEITVGTQVNEGVHNSLNTSLGRHQLQAVPLVGRQPQALNNTFPTYPIPIYPIKQTNRTRSPLSNQMYGGAIAMSGIFRNTKPAASSGVLVGLLEAGYEFSEIYMDIEGASKHGGTPGCLITGRPGAGKALTLDTLVLTPDGPVPMRDIKRGHRVFGSDGGVYPVSFETDIMRDHRVYRMTLSDGQVIKADAEHQWYASLPTHRNWWTAEDAEQSGRDVIERQRVLRAMAAEVGEGERLSANQIADRIAERLGDLAPWSDGQGYRSTLNLLDVPYTEQGTWRRLYDLKAAYLALADRMPFIRPQRVGKGVAQVMTTEEILGYTNSGKSGKVSIPLAQAMEYPERNLPVDPYILGAWLGDGGAGSGRIAAASVGSGVDPVTGKTDMESMSEQLTRAGIEHGIRNEYELTTYGLQTQLREAGVLFDKHIPDIYLRSSYAQRLALLQGLLDTDGCITSSDQIGFNNTNRLLVEQTVELIRSLGLKVKWLDCDECGVHCIHEYEVAERRNLATFSDGSGRTVTARKKCWGIDFNTTVPVFRLPRKLNKQMAVCKDSRRNDSLFIESIERIDSEPVKCISVDSPDNSYLIQGGVVTHNTQQMLQMITQVVYNNQRAFMLNLKPINSSLKPAFDVLGGITINMGHKYLSDNPGLMDPVYYFRERSRVADILFQAISMALDLKSEKGLDAATFRSKLSADIADRASDLRNQCSYDIIFGNEEKGTLPITLDQVRETIEDKIRSQSFWKAFISSDPYMGQSNDMILNLNKGRPVLIEWDTSLSLPDQSEVESGNLNDTQIDSLISANIAFQYAIEAITNGKDDGTSKSGGVVAVDESWALTASKDTTRLIEGAGRAWRELNILLLLGTQRLLDWLDPSGSNMATYFSRYIIMAISQDDPDELEMFFKLSGLPRDGMAGKENERYIIEAGAQTEDEDEKKRKRNKVVPRAYYIDRIHNFEGGIICGPWPKKELGAGRTDKSGKEARITGRPADDDEEPLYDRDYIKKITDENESIQDFEDYAPVEQP